MTQMSARVVELFNQIHIQIDEKNYFGQRTIGDVFLKAVYKYWGKYIKNYVNYNYFAYCFNRTYFWKNLLKNLLFFDRYDFLVKDKILDVGSGAAIASVAIGNLIYEKENRKLKISLIDKSKKQLCIAKKFLEDMPVELISSKVNSFEFTQQVYDELVIFSYFVCEQKKTFIKELFLNRNKLRGGFVIIDYRENIEFIASYFKEYGDKNLKTVHMKYEIPENLESCIGEKIIKIYGCYYRKKSNN